MSLLSNIKVLLHKMFWIDKLEGTYKFLTFESKFSMYFYIVSILFFILMFFIFLDVHMLISVGLIIVMFPIMYRIIMGIQRFFNDI